MERGLSTAPRLIMVRHAESTANVEGVLDTRLPGYPLSDTGHHQAAQLAARLAGEPVVAVYASLAIRAQQTAAPVAAWHGLQVQICPGVHEVFIGDLEGRYRPEDHDTLHAMYRAWHTGDLHNARPGGESAKQVLDRYLLDVAAMRAAHPDGTVVLVSHGAAIRLATVALASNVDGSFAGPRLLSNTSTIVLEADGSSWRCRRWDDIELD